MSIKVLIVDDHELLLSGFEASLSDNGIDVAGKFLSAENLIGHYEDLRPNVLVLDVRLGGGNNGLDACKDLLNKYPEAKIVILSQFDQDCIIEESYKSGALSFVKKSESIETLCEAITKASQGEQFFTEGVAQKLVRFKMNSKNLDVLNEKEKDVFVLAAKGLLNNEIASELGYSLRTIVNIIGSIKEKLDLNRQVDFTLLAIKNGLINVD